jgi:hypothetical protein
VARRAAFAAPENRAQDRPWHYQKGRRKTLIDVVVIVLRNPNLLQIIAALRSPGRFAGRLHGRQD